MVDNELYYDFYSDGHDRLFITFIGSLYRLRARVRVRVWFHVHENKPCEELHYEETVTPLYCYHVTV